MPGALEHHEIAIALCRQGRFEEAFTHVLRAIELAPRVPTPYVNAAIIAATLFGAEAALKWCDSALAIDPNCVPALLVAATALTRQGKAEDAVRLCLKATSINPLNAQALGLLAVATSVCGNYEVAFEVLQNAKSISDDPDLRLKTAVLLLELGRRDEALAELAAVLTTNPGFVAAQYVRAVACDFALESNEIVPLESLLESSRSLQIDDRIRLHFALGNAYLASAEVDAAFKHLARGNALKRASVHYDRATEERFIESSMRSYDGLSRGRGYDSDLPVFVVGMPRSGTTLVEQILASAPTVYGAGELGYIAELSRKADAPEPASLGAEYVRRIRALSRDAARIVDKMPTNFAHLGFIHRILPRARFIHCRRDPLDTCFSCYKTLFDDGLFFSYDLSELAAYFRLYERSMDHWKRIVPPDLLLEVQYEDLVTDPEPQIRRILAFCGVSWDARCLQFHLTERAVRTASLHDVRRPIHTASVGRSRRYIAHLGELVQLVSPSRER